MVSANDGSSMQVYAPQILETLHTYFNEDSDALNCEILDQIHNAWLNSREPSAHRGRRTFAGHRLGPLNGFSASSLPASISRNM